MPYPECKNSVVFPLESQANYLNSQEIKKKETSQSKLRPLNDLVTAGEIVVNRT